MFTGSTEVAKTIARQLALRLNPDGAPVPLIAETGGQNALVVDSSALAEQVVADVLASAFDSAGQRCSALRVLAVQEDVADRVLAMLHGALAELTVGDPAAFATDIGPVISAEARDGILAHIAAMRRAGHPVRSAPLGAGCDRGIFVAPTIIELAHLSDLMQEVFGPVLHVLRFPPRRSGRGDGGDQCDRIRPHLRRAQPHRRDHRPRHPAVLRRQHLRQPQPDRRRGGGAAVRRARLVRDGAEGGRPALPAPPAGRSTPGGPAGPRRAARRRLGGLAD